jgi:hypothetical protein
MKVSSFVALAAAVAALLPSGVAFAGGETAEKLFLEGRDAVRKGNDAEGCPLFARADALESTFGTLTNLGECAERKGDWREAWQRFTAATAKAGTDKDRSEYLRLRLAAVEPHLAIVTVVPSATAEPLREIAIDGAAIGTGAPVAVVAGPHVLRATFASGAEATLPEVAVAGTRPRWETPTAPVAVVPPRVGEKPTEVPRYRNPAKILLIAGGATALVGLVFGALAATTLDAADACPVSASGARPCPSSATLSEARRGQTFATLSTIGVTTGLAAAGVGAGLWFFGGSSPGAASATGGRAPLSAGLTFSGRF